ncbi:MAG: DUF190 domain-containing protein [Pseudomonadota bacterium]
MQLHPAKRVAIVIEAPMLRRLTEALEDAGVTGYSVLPVLAGSGRSGPWSSDSSFGTAGTLVQVVCILSEDKLQDMVDRAFPVVERHIGMITVTDCEVLRPERF